MKLSRTEILDLIIEEVSSIYAGADESESIFKERELTHDVARTRKEISKHIENAVASVEYPTNMDTIEITVGQLKNWEDVLTKFLMALGGE